MRPTQGRPDPAGRRRDAGFFLPLAGVLVLFPPFINLFTRPRLLWGVPLEVVYLFSIWLGLVLGAFAISRGLPTADGESDAETPPRTGRSGD